MWLPEKEKGWFIVYQNHISDIPTQVEDIMKHFHAILFVKFIT